MEAVHALLGRLLGKFRTAHAEHSLDFPRIAVTCCASLVDTIESQVVWERDVPLELSETVGTGAGRDGAGVVAGPAPHTILRQPTTDPTWILDDCPFMARASSTWLGTMLQGHVVVIDDLDST